MGRHFNSVAKGKRIEMRLSTIAGLALALFLLPLAVSAQPIEQVIPIPGTQAVVKVGEADGRAFAAVSRDGGESFWPLVAPDYRLMFHYGVHDPLRERPEIPGMLRAGSGSRLHVVQFFTQPL